ncbi:YbhB/YbcL family Raf kinase inhibitor-like protein [bacterium]|nr:YbhB/YbcL family Raf kinase inhibitor-like protein [bacterium]
MEKLTVTSTVFSAGGSIPSRYTCDGMDISPQLAWSDPPDGTKSFALICDDPDAPAGTWVHWVMYNIPAGVQELSEKMPSQEKLGSGALQGTNDFRRIGYGGPCPPSGTHRYYFKVYALDTMLDLKPGATKQQLLRAMEGHIRAQGELMGRYSRQR